MNDAWVEGAPSVEFNGITQAAFLADIDAAAADDAAIADLEADLKMKREVRDDKYVSLNEKRSKVGLGVVGPPPTATTAHSTAQWASSANPIGLRASTEKQNREPIGENSMKKKVLCLAFILLFAAVANSQEKFKISKECYSDCRGHITGFNYTNGTNIYVDLGYSKLPQITFEKGNVRKVFELSRNTFSDNASGKRVSANLNSILLTVYRLGQTTYNRSTSSKNHTESGSYLSLRRLRTFF